MYVIDDGRKKCVCFWKYAQYFYKALSHILLNKSLNLYDLTSSLHSDFTKPCEMKFEVHRTDRDNQYQTSLQVTK